MLVGKLKTKTFDSWLPSVAQDRRMLNLAPVVTLGFPQLITVCNAIKATYPDTSILLVLVIA